MNELIKMALSMAGMPQTQVTEIENALPAMTRLLNDTNKNNLNTIIPVIRNVLTFIQNKK